MSKYKFQSVVYKEGKYYVAQCLDIDVSSFGNTEKESLENLREALELYLEDGGKKAIKNVENPKVHTLNLQHT